MPLVMRSASPPAGSNTCCAAPCVIVVMYVSSVRCVTLLRTCKKRLVLCHRASMMVRLRPCSIIDICLRLKSGACAEGIDQIGLSLEDLGRDPQVLRIVLVWLSSQLRSPVRDDAAALKEAARSGTIDSPGVDADDCPWDKRIPAHIRLRSREQADKVGDGAPLESPLALDRCEEALALCKDATDVYVASDFILGVDEGHGQQDAEHVQSDADAD
jgi:hypothetical protein